LNTISADRSEDERRKLTVETTSVNCAEACVNGCIMPDNCPQGEHVKTASNFINSTSLDRMHEIAEEARRKKLTEPPKWVFPDFP